MGKSWKSRAHLNTGYPYNPIRAAHLQVLRPKVRNEDEENLFLGMYAENHPVFSKAEFKTHNPDLKRLEFLRVYSQYYASKIAHLYQSSRAILPPSCAVGLDSIETRVTHLGAPLFAGIQNGGEQLLWTLDTKIDAVLRAADQATHPFLGPSKALSLADEPTQPPPRNAYVFKLEDTVQFLRENGVRGSARHALATLLRRLDETKGPSFAGTQPLLPATVGEAWGRVAESPAVNRLLEQAQPSLEYTQRKYTDAHDAVVASAAYHRAVGTAAEVLARVTESFLFKTAVERLYPAIAGIADPALEKIARSAVTQAVVDHLKPVARDAEPSGGVLCTPC